MKLEQIKRKLGELSEKKGNAGGQTRLWFQRHGKMLAVLGALAVIVIAVGAVSGGSGKSREEFGNAAAGTREDGRSGMNKENAGNAAARLQADADADGRGDIQEGAGEISGKTVSGQNGTVQGPALEKDQIELLEKLAAALKDRDYETGGALLLDNEQRLEYLFYQVMKGEQYLYRDGGLYRDQNGEGLVMRRPMSVYYGKLERGVPEGAGVAVQGIELNGLRYDYADGNWSSGKLNGHAAAGYRYYRGSGSGESLAGKRTGMFVDDLMDGAFTYETVSFDGETTIWELEAEAGKTKLDAHWIYEAGKQCYYLPSKEISRHTYVLPEAELEDIRWRNMLPWNE